MNWDAISAVGEAVEGLAVIASLVYLVPRIHQTREMQLAESVRDVFTNGNAIFEYTSYLGNLFDDDKAPNTNSLDRMNVSSLLETGNPDFRSGKTLSQ